MENDCKYWIARGIELLIQLVIAIQGLAKLLLWEKSQKIQDSNQPKIEGMSS